jgi:formylglycine-generating enzyme required for sulfatase activity
MVLIPPGEFAMGSTPQQIDAAVRSAIALKVQEATVNRIRDGEGPQHPVVITDPFLMASTEVTIGQFKKFVEATNYVTEGEKFGGADSSNTNETDATKKAKTWRAPGYPITDESPVTQVTWNDCVVFCNWLSGSEKLPPCYQPDAQQGWILLPAGGYRLPAEAEWEYACRAGTTTQYSCGDDVTQLEQFGWYKKNDGGRPRTGGQKLANAFGMHDMPGNVMEWCQDWYEGKGYDQAPPDSRNGPASNSPRATRGSHWHAYEIECRSAWRVSSTPTSRMGIRGFRIARAAGT